jgi:molybdopterin converting factor small subunit
MVDECREDDTIMLLETAPAEVRVAAPNLTLTGLAPAPREAWQTMLRFGGPTPGELHAMRQTVDVLFQRGYELVVATYDALRRNPETAAILGWEHGFDEEHLAERRRFFTIWLARTLSIDLGADFAGYLFRAGQIHAAHGPRHIHTPPMWVTGSMGLVLSAFAGFIQEAHSDAAVVAPALSGWNKYLMLQLNQMLSGYESARALDDGELDLPVRAYGRLRHEWGRDQIEVRFRPGDTVASVLAKLAHYAPLVRDMLFEPAWRAEDAADEWMRVVEVSQLRGNWRILLNGRDLRYDGGFDRALSAGDALDLFPPGR